MAFRPSPEAKRLILLEAADFWSQGYKIVEIAPLLGVSVPWLSKAINEPENRGAFLVSPFISGRGSLSETAEELGVSRKAVLLAALNSRHDLASSVIGDLQMIWLVTEGWIKVSPEKFRYYKAEREARTTWRKDTKSRN